MGQDAVQQLVELSLLEAMPAEGKSHVAEVFLEISERRDLADGEELVHEGYLGFESGFVLVEGTVAIVKGGEQLSEVSAPALLGEMSQFKTGDTRTATVRAIGAVSALHFHWDDFYEEVQQGLCESERTLLMDALEQLVWKRFSQDGLLTVGLFRDLSAALRLKVCIVFPWIAERVSVKKGEAVFEREERCKSIGYLLTKGSIRLVREDGREWVVKAPNIVGVMPRHEPSQQWTATATPSEDAEMLGFSWQQYMERLQERLSHEEQRQLVDSMKAHASEHFWH